MKEFDNGLEEKWEFDFSPPTNLETPTEKIKEFLRRDKNPTLIFYGGEPLVMKDKIIELIDSLKDIPNIKFRMQTNAKLLNKFPTKYLKQIGKILVSIDGDKERTDLNRGKETYDLVIQNLKEARQKGYEGEIVARMTLSTDVGADIFLQVFHLLSLGLFDSIHWQIDAGFYKSDFNKKEFEKFANNYNKQISKLVELWMQEMKKGNVLKIYPFLGILEPIMTGKTSKLQCGSGYANYTITTDGRIAACPIMNNVKEFYCGSLDTKPEELKKIEIKNRCENCEYKNICGGRCLYSNHAQLWPEEGEELICKTIIHLIEEIKKQIPEIKQLIKNGIIKKSDLQFEKYFGPEIIP